MSQTREQKAIEKAAQDAAASNSSRKGKPTIVLPNGVVRADYIRQRADAGLDVSTIRSEINHMLKAQHEASGGEGKPQEVGYQSVYSVVRAHQDAAAADQA